MKAYLLGMLPPPCVQALLGMVSLRLRHTRESSAEIPAVLTAPAELTIKQTLWLRELVQVRPARHRIVEKQNTLMVF